MWEFRPFFPIFRLFVWNGQTNSIHLVTMAREKVVLIVERCKRDILFQQWTRIDTNPSRDHVNENRFSYQFVINSFSTATFIAGLTRVDVEWHAWNSIKSWQRSPEKTMWMTRTDSYKETKTEMLRVVFFWFIVVVWSISFCAQFFSVCGIIIIKWSETSSQEEKQRKKMRNKRQKERNWMTETAN